MNAQELIQAIQKIEECADEAKRVVQGGSVPQDLRKAVESLHQQASQAKHRSASQQDEGALREALMQIEQSSDRAMEACRNAGNVEPQVQEAVKRTHAEASRAKKQVEADSPA
jgi:hypothetical protein